MAKNEIGEIIGTVIGVIGVVGLGVALGVAESKANERAAAERRRLAEVATNHERRGELDAARAIRQMLDNDEPAAPAVRRPLAAYSPALDQADELRRRAKAARSRYDFDQADKLEAAADKLELTAY